MPDTLARPDLSSSSASIPARAPAPRVNVGPGERLASAAAGGLLLGWGLSRGGLRGWLAASAGAALIGRAATGSCPAYRAAGIDHAEPAPSLVTVRRSITIARPPLEVYAFWRDLANLPRFLSHLESVERLGDGRSRWTADLGAAGAYRWTAQIVREDEGRAIAWRTLPGSDVAHEGEVRFVPAPAGRGTELHLALAYEPPYGTAGVLAARLLRREAGRRIGDELRRFRMFLEAGEVATTEGQPSGRRGRRLP